MAKGIHLIGFENWKEDGVWNMFNFVLSNGARSTQRDENYPTTYSHCFPKGAISRVRSVTVNYADCIGGFQFFDKDGALLWKYGYLADPFTKQETVELAEN